MAGKRYTVSRTPHEFRMALFKGKNNKYITFVLEHFGLTDERLLEDPLDRSFVEYLNTQGKINTKFYYDVFRAEPDDYQRTFNDLKESRKQFKDMGLAVVRKNYDKEKHKLRGFFVEYPVNFLKDAVLELKASNLANLVPAINFV